MVPVGLMYTVGYLAVLSSVRLTALMLGATASRIRVRDYATSAAPLLVAAMAVLDTLRF